MAMLVAQLKAINRELSPLNALESLAREFEDLANTPMPDPGRPTPIYVSRMHFADWAAKIRKNMPKY